MSGWGWFRSGIGTDPGEKVSHLPPDRVPALAEDGEDFPGSATGLVRVGKRPMFLLCAGRKDGAGFIGFSADRYDQMRPGNQVGVQQGRSLPGNVDSRLIHGGDRQGMDAVGVRTGPCGPDGEPFEGKRSGPSFSHL